MRKMSTRTRITLLALTLVLLGRVAPAVGEDTLGGESYFSTGLAHMREGRVDLALEAFKHAVDADSENPYFRKGLGQAYAAKGEWKKAIEQFHKALELNPYYTDVRNDLGSALILAGEREEGKNEFLAAYGDPTNPMPEVSARNLGQAYLEERNYTEAMSWFRTAIDRAEAYADPYLGLARALVATDRLDEAVVLLESGVEKAPESAGLRLALGQVYFRVGRFTESREAFEQAMAKDPSGRAGRAAAAELEKLPH
jgi:type IV pilus assembly protein PilF